jgi:hypothetical protein
MPLNISTIANKKPETPQIGVPAGEQQFSIKAD